MPRFGQSPIDNSRQQLLGAWQLFLENAEAMTAVGGYNDVGKEATEEQEAVDGCLASDVVEGLYEHGFLSVVLETQWEEEEEGLP
ncbi:hypothetical protein FIBSPDRAFT_866907 [Athelia psychrophila]|uniref:Uncharacterized protein n=1 Tax=Athelia psychrophila TaxID=1759441 RepID=A0A166EFW6_9AGAM|nr:hypothetical protein FIBSPDRAFT_866907 [Fibularhizoctonia sp. CBS 109695]